MSFYKSIGLVISVMVVVGSCKTSQQASTSTKDNKEVKITIEKPQPEPQYPYRPAETLRNDLLHTKLEVGFDWEKQYLNGIATLSFKPYFYPQDSLFIDAKGMDIHSIELLGKKKGEGKSLQFDYDKKVIAIRLDKKYTRKDTFEIKIKYTAKPNELPKGGSDAITSDIGLYFINPMGTEPGKPKQIWTQGETEASSCWFPTIDTPNEKTTQEMYITVDTSFTVLTNGKFVSSKVNQNGTKTEYWKQDLPHAPYLFMMAIGKYAIVKDKWNDLEVNYYVEPEYAKYAKDIFGHTPEMLQFFSDKLGYKYPWSKYSQVVVRDYVSGAMENTTATIFMEALQQDDRALADEHWDYIIAHELFHHWFGDLVTCESWSNLPLNESFANYSEYLWFEYKFGRDEAEYHGEKEVDEYMDETRKKKVPLIRYHYKDKEDMFDRHSYNKGGRILHMLRNYLGDEAFFEALKLYLQQNQYKPAEVHHLRLAFEEVTGQDLNWFFDQWFLKGGHPILEVEHTYNNGFLTLTVKQLQDTTLSPIYKLPVKLDIWSNGIKKTYPITVSLNEEKFEFQVPAQPNLVVFDSDFQLLGKLSHKKSDEEWMFQYQNYEGYLGKKQSLENLFMPTLSGTTLVNPFENPQIKETLLKALNDPFWVIRSYALDQFSTFHITFTPDILARFQTIAQEDPKPAVRSKAIYFLSSYSNKDYVEIYKKALTAKPYSVAGAGLSGYLKSGDKSVSINLEEYEKINNLHIMIPLAEYFVSTGTKGKFGWFKQKLENGSPRAIYNLMGFFSNYIINVAPENKEEAKKILGKIAENNKYEVIRNFAKDYLKEIEEKTH